MEERIFDPGGLKLLGFVSSCAFSSAKPEPPDVAPDEEEERIVGAGGG